MVWISLAVRVALIYYPPGMIELLGRCEISSDEDYRCHGLLGAWPLSSDGHVLLSVPRAVVVCIDADGCQYLNGVLMI